MPAYPRGSADGLIELSGFRQELHDQIHSELQPQDSVSSPVYQPASKQLEHGVDSSY